ncbi:phage holin family protein [Pontibacter sp. BT310]|jgi:putative membrane protein|uniref:Phage holin family protein n=1 Tax=Pontibacter populi TaxID=890055 RepID=A0ABS6XF11_9BACT|nr:MULTISPECIES: phage holin family protein [Pontibacter]MBJ6119697.1 phage holin family protein [Pontibacter sp. BT310]MBR0572126.1 phage holin family protein [Microvirga sp. STS03]MBW3366550.1 phage holin family protein [Pontibacter populi]
MGFIIKLLITGVAVVLASYILPGVHIDTFVTALILALVLALLNAVVRPILVILTIPVTILTLGLFLLVINALIILLADYLIAGFTVDGFLWALIFSLVLSVINAILDMIF